MSERKEPTISPINVDKEDSRPRARAQTGGSSAGGAQGAQRPAPVSGRPVVVRSPLGPFAILLTLIAMAGTGFVYWQLLESQKIQAQYKTELAEASGRIEQLEKKLSLADDESTQSLTVLQAKIKENESEIRKLWGVAYDRNRTAISELKDNFKSLSANLNDAEKRLKTTIASASDELKVLSELLNAQQSVIAQVNSGYQEQIQKLSGISKRVENLDSELRKKVLANEEAVKAIDAFRLQMNREILQLKGG